MKSHSLGNAIIPAFAFVLAAAAAPTASTAAPKGTSAVLNTYANIAEAAYEDALMGAHILRAAVEDLLDAPSPASLAAARDAWMEARTPYLQTEVFRFGNPIVDEWEGRVNAWPLDEGLIDYVAGGGAEAVNVVANPVVRIGGRDIDATRINGRLLADELHEAGGMEANVATGYHAIEFLLWGQDLNGTGSGAGARPHTDFDLSACTGGNCGRRVAILSAASDLLLDDLAYMKDAWAPGGAARDALMRDGGLAAIVTGMGSLSYGELAGERMMLGLLLHDPEEEQDCFSDATHHSHYYNALGVQNVYHGRYVRPDGQVVAGASLSDLVRRMDPDLDDRLRGRLDETMAAMAAMVESAESGVAYDQLIGPDNPSGNALVRAGVAALAEQTVAIEHAAAALNLSGVSIESSDALSGANIGG